MTTAHSLLYINGVTDITEGHRTVDFLRGEGYILRKKMSYTVNIDRKEVIGAGTPGRCVRSEA